MYMHGKRSSATPDVQQCEADDTLYAGVQVNAAFAPLAATLYTDGTASSLSQQGDGGDGDGPASSCVQVDTEHYDVVERTPVGGSDLQSMGWSAEDAASMPQHTGEGEAPAATRTTFLVHVADRKQAEARLRGVGDVGAYLLRAKSQQEISSGTVAMS